MAIDSSVRAGWPLNSGVKEAVNRLRENLQTLEDSALVKQEFDLFKNRLKELNEQPERPDDWKERESRSFRMILQALQNTGTPKTKPRGSEIVTDDSVPTEREINTVKTYFQRVTSAKSGRPGITAKEMGDRFFNDPEGKKILAIFQSIFESDQRQYIIVGGQVIAEREKLLSLVCDEMKSTEKEQLRNPHQLGNIKLSVCREALGRYMQREFDIPEDVEYDDALVQAILDRVLTASK